MTNPLQRATWPLPVQCCIECHLPMGHGHPDDCKCRGEGLFESVPVYPASYTQELVEAVQRAINRIEATDPETEFGDDFEADVASAVKELETTLAHFNKTGEK